MVQGVEVVVDALLDECDDRVVCMVGVDTRDEHETRMRDLESEILTRSFALYCAYREDAECLVQSDNEIVAVFFSDLKLHERMAHLHVEGVRCECGACQLTKARKKSVKAVRLPRFRTTRAFEQLAFDAHGPHPTTSVDGFQWNLIMTDDFTREVYQGCIKVQPDIVRLVVETIEDARTRVGNSKACFTRTRCDNHAVHRGAAMRKALRALQVLMTWSIPNRAEGNGRCERLMSPLFRSVESCLTSVDVRLHSYAAAYVAHTYNSIPRKVSDSDGVRYSHFNLWAPRDVGAWYQARFHVMVTGSREEQRRELETAKPAVVTKAALAKRFANRHPFGSLCSIRIYPAVAKMQARNRFAVFLGYERGAAAMLCGYWSANQWHVARTMDVNVLSVFVRDIQMLHSDTVLAKLRGLEERERETADKGLVGANDRGKYDKRQDEEEESDTESDSHGSAREGEADPQEVEHAEAAQEADGSGDAVIPEVFTNAEAADMLPMHAQKVKKKDRVRPCKAEAEMFSGEESDQPGTATARAALKKRKPGKRDPDTDAPTTKKLCVAPRERTLRIAGVWHHQYDPVAKKWKRGRPVPHKLEGTDEPDVIALLTYKECMTEDEVGWTASIAVEEEALLGMGAFRPATEKDFAEVKKGDGVCLPASLIFVKKSCGRLKSRMVLCGNFLKENGRFSAPVASYTILRYALVIGASRGWVVVGMDISTAFLHAETTRTVLFRAPRGMKCGGEWMRATKCIYGLPEAPLRWYQHIRAYLTSTRGWTEATARGLFKKQVKGADGREISMMLVLYVDDILIFSSCAKAAEDERSEIQKVFPGKNTEWVGDKFSFLGLEVEYAKGSVKISAEGQIHKIARAFNIKPNGRVRNPAHEVGLADTDGEEVSFDLRALCGSLNFVASTCRPDIAYASNALSRHMSFTPTAGLKRAGEQVVQYLLNTDTLGVWYSGSKAEKLLVSHKHWELWCDASFAPSRDLVSVSGCALSYRAMLLWWQSKRQRTIAYSSMEAEWVCCAEGLVLFDQSLTQFVGFMGEGTEKVIVQDNLPLVRGCTSECRTLNRSFQLKHRQVLEHSADLMHVSDAKMRVDALTKVNVTQQKRELLL